MWNVSGHWVLMKFLEYDGSQDTHLDFPNGGNASWLKQS